MREHIFYWNFEGVLSWDWFSQHYVWLLHSPLLCHRRESGQGSAKLQIFMFQPVAIWSGSNLTSHQLIQTDVVALNTISSNWRRVAKMCSSRLLCRHLWQTKLYHSGYPVVPWELIGEQRDQSLLIFMWAAESCLGHWSSVFKLNIR